MARPKLAKNCILPFWASARTDNRDGRFIQVGNSLFLSKAFQSLKPSSQTLYLCMMMESGGKKYFEFPQSAAKKYGITASTLRRAVAELKAHGFIAETCSGRNTRTPNEYMFISTWKQSK